MKKTLWKTITILALLCFFAGCYSTEQQYDNVLILQPDGTVIKGHEAVSAWFAKEEALLEKFGASLIFQVYRVNINAKTISELQGERVAEITVGADFASGTDTVVAVKKKVSLLLEKEEAKLSREGREASLKVEQTDRITFWFDGRPMVDNTLFYADNRMMLPAWVQVFLHDCESRELIERIKELSKSSSQ